jgi:hypothetical protein
MLDDRGDDERKVLESERAIKAHHEADDDNGDALSTFRFGVFAKI